MSAATTALAVTRTRSLPCVPSLSCALLRSRRLDLSAAQLTLWFRACPDQAYEVAALDSTPPYWETTIITPQGLLGPDDICVDGLPVGSPFGFAWNLLVSMSFQFVGASI